MAIITMVDGSKFEGTVKECAEYQREWEKMHKRESKPSASKKGEQKTAQKESQKETKKSKKEYGLDSVKFDKYNDGNCNWDYYKAVRTNYCYTRQGCKVWKGKVTKPEGWTFNKEQWEADKEAFNKAFPYIKVADRK